MDLQLNGKVALVLASSKGLGRASAAALAGEGAQVIISSRKAEQLERTAAELSRHSRLPVSFLPADLSEGSEVTELIRRAAARFGRLDILVNNAGGPPFDRFEHLTDGQWQQAFELNLMSFARAAREAIPFMKAAGSGRIINIISGSVKSVLADSVLSTTMRMGVVGMAKLLAEEFGPYQVTVNNVAPGLILTDRIRENIPKDRDPAEALQERAEGIPLRRIGRPEELAALVAFLASAQASYISGTTISVDGGGSRSVL